MSYVNSVFQATMADESTYDTVVIPAPLIHITMTPRGSEAHHRHRLFILCPVDLKNISMAIQLSRADRAVPMVRREEATCPECQVLAVVVIANGLTVQTDPKTFRKKLRSLLK